MFFVPIALLLLQAANPQPPANSPADSAAAISSEAKALLDLAFSAGERMPTQPHARNRSKLMGTVVDACFELKQPENALRYAEKIGDWRLGLALASAAVMSAEQGESKQVRDYVNRADAQLRAAEKSGSILDWQRDRVRSRLAQALILINEVDDAMHFEDGLGAGELAPVQSAKGRKLNADELKKRLDGVDTVVAAGGFEEIKSTLSACAILYEQFYAEKELRDSIQAKVTSSWAKLPLQVRVEILMSMARTALKQSDRAKALELVGLAQEQMQVGQWLPESEVAFLGELTKLRARAGDMDRARRELEAAIKKYDEAEQRIVNIYRASALRPVAEAWVLIGDRSMAEKLYFRVVEAGVQNPNSRPRADDLAATACSMAVVGFSPGEKLFTRMQAILSGLGDPW